MLSKYWTITSKPLWQADPSIFELREEEIQGGCIIKNLYVTLNPSLKPFLFTDINPGEHLPGDAVGICVKSNRTDIQVGDHVVHRTSISEYSKILDDTEHEHWYKKSWVKVLPQDVDPLLYLSVCGLAGLTAYIGMEYILKLQEGMTVGVSGASGTSGVLLAQMALKKGCEVIGFTSTQEKADWLESLGVKSIISENKSIEELDRETKKLVPEGFDAYMEHVSNLHLLNGINNMKLNGRIGLCGLMKSYTSQIAHGPNLLNVIANNINIKGYVVGRHYKMWDQFQEYILDNYDSFEFKQHIEHGLDKVPSTYDNLYNSYGKGKLVIKI